MADAAAAPQRARRGPAPIASFDHDESSPESRAAQLADIREESGRLAPPEGRSRSHSSPAVAPRIDISRASSSSNRDSRDSSPELALLAGGAERLGFREDGALDLRSSTEELAFLEGAPGGPPEAGRRPSRPPAPGPPGQPGRTSRLSSVGSQCSAVSGRSRASRLSVASAASRSPSPHRMLLETSFCGPKPIDTDPELCAAALEGRLLGVVASPADDAPAPPEVEPPPPPPGDARDRREVRTEATVEAAPTPIAPGAGVSAPAVAAPPLDDKRQKESRNRRARSRERRDPGAPRGPNRSRDVVRIRLKPDDEYDDDDDSDAVVADAEPARKPATLEIETRAEPAPRRSPSPAGVATVSRKSSFCSLFKSRETIASPESPAAAGAPRRKRSLTDGRSRSGSGDRGATATSAARLRGSVLSLFRGPRRPSTSPARGSRDVSPATRAAPAPSAPAPGTPRGARLRYYEDTADGVIHIPLRTPPDERPAAEVARPQPARPASAPQPRARGPDDDGGSDRPLSSAAAAPAPPPPPPEVPGAAPPAPLDDSAAAAPARRRERFVFATQIGSGERVFTTQLSVTKTPSVASETSHSPPSPLGSDGDCAPPAADRAADVALATSPKSASSAPDADRAEARSRVATPRDSSESEASSEGARGGDVERRGLVAQESVDEELPYVPTTLPLERSLALPMVPVRERGPVLVSRLERPRAPAPLPAPRPAPPPPTHPPRAPPDKLRIHLPRRARAPAEREARPPPEWIDFEEVPERRKPPRRIETLPAREAVYGYVEPERCRCECHAPPPPPPDDELPLLPRDA